MNPLLRASDADRERVVAELQRHVGAGRLSLDEFSERADAAYRCTTVGQLAELTHDLPVESRVGASGGRYRRIPAAAVVAAAVLSLLLGGAVLAGGAAAAHAGPMPVMSGEMCR